MADNLPIVFVCYSHADEAWKSKLDSQLGVLERIGKLESWSDTRIGAGEDWLAEIQEYLTRASIGVVLVSPDSLTSDFILKEEVATLLRKRVDEGLLLVPVIVEPCPWERVPWLSKLQCRPKGTKALSLMPRPQSSAALAEVAREIDDWIERSSQWGRPVGDGVSRTGSHPQQPLISSLFTKDIETRMWQGSPFPRPDEPPRLPDGYVVRNGLITEISTATTSSGWIHLHGEAGTGKTLLSAAFVESFCKAVAWVALRGETGSRLVELLLGHLQRQVLEGRDDPSDEIERRSLSSREICRNAARRNPSGFVLVVDEIPSDLATHEELFEVLQGLATEFFEKGSHLITTGQRQLPADVLTRPEVKVSEISIPRLGKQEIVTLLNSLGAPSDRPILADVILGVTRGHPQLVHGYAIYLQQNGWREQDQTALLFGADPTGQRLEVRRGLGRLVRDPESRRLLDRLSLINDGFGWGMVFRLSALEPSISRPAEAFWPLVGPWIRKLDEDAYDVSPLLIGTGSEALSEAEVRLVHEAIARLRISQETLGPFDVLAVVGHLAKAARWEILTDVLAQFAFKIDSVRDASALSFLLPITPDLSGPAGWPLGSRLMFRVVQSRVGAWLGHANANAIVDAVASVVAEDESALEPRIAFAALVLAGPLNKMCDPIRSARLVVQASRIPGRWDGGSMPELDVRGPLPLLWGPLTQVHTAEQFESVIDIFASMSRSERVAAFTPDVTKYSGPMLLVERILLGELDKPEDDRDWTKALQLIQKFIELSRLPGCEPFCAPAIRVKALILADGLEDVDGALRILGRLDDYTSEERFLLGYTSGSIRFAHRDAESALDHLSGALRERPDGYITIQVDAYQRAAVAAGALGKWPLARGFLIKAWKLDRSYRDFYQELRILSALAWASWQIGERKKSCAALVSVVGRLTARGDFDDPTFRELLAKTAHVLGWVSSIALSGAPPQQLPGGGEYVEPTPAWFLPHELLENPNLPRRSDILWQIIGLLAQEVGMVSQSIELLQKAKQLHGEQNSRFACLIDAELARAAARQGRYEDALTLSRSALRGPYSWKLRAGGGTADELAPTLAEWSGLPAAERMEWEKNVFFDTVGPAMVRSLATSESDRESITMVSRLRANFIASDPPLADLARWNQDFDRLRRAFSELATQESVGGEIDTLEASERNVRAILALRMSRLPETALERSCGLQAMVFAYVGSLGETGLAMLEEIANFVCMFWATVLQQRRFALRSPRVLQEACVGLDTDRKVAARRVLLAAAQATGVVFGKELQKALEV